MHQKTTEFPEGFLWGASSSAFQIEGGWNLGGKGLTVADFNSFKRSHIQADTKVASDFYHHWKEDIDYMAELGLKNVQVLHCVGQNHTGWRWSCP